MPKLTVSEKLKFAQTLQDKRAKRMNIQTFCDRKKTKLILPRAQPRPTQAFIIQPSSLIIELIKREGNLALNSLLISKNTLTNESLIFALDDLRWEFIKENKKVRKQELDQESDQRKQEKKKENKNSTKETT